MQPEAKGGDSPDLRHADFSAGKTKPVLMKNIPFSEALEIAELVNYQPGQVVSRTLAQNKALNITVFAFDAGEGLSTHQSTGDALVQVLEGRGRFTVAEKACEVASGQSIVLPANVPHAVDAVERFKMLLTVVKPGG